MNKVPQPLYTAAQVRELDRIAIEDFGVDGYALMKRAGRAAYRWLRYRYPRARGITVYCGSGNNGGDGYVVAALALQAGMVVHLVNVGEAKSDTAGRALADFLSAGGVLSGFNDGERPEGDVVVDALLGTGLERAPAGRYGRAVELINESGRPVLALDIPSGLHADTGQILAPCIRADATATFIGRKLGCLTADGPAVSGRLVFDDLDVPAGIYQHVQPVARVIDPRAWAERIGARPATAHKGDAGRVLIVGGNRGMPGAPCLSARAAHRSGAGLVYLATRHGAGELVPNTPESMATEIRAPGDIAPMFEHADVIAVGPGLGRDDWARGVWESVLASQRPLVVDADALYWLAHKPARREDWILTPHPGEAASLLDTSTRAVQSDRVKAAQALQARFGGVVVLKGPGTLVSGRVLHLCDRGNPGMASGGMGDVLTGVIAALLGQGLPAEDAACYGVWCHATAADRASERGLVGLTAGDVIDALRSTVGEP